MLVCDFCGFGVEFGGVSLLRMCFYCVGVRGVGFVVGDLCSLVVCFGMVVWFGCLFYGGELNDLEF